MARLNLIVVKSNDAERLASFYTIVGLTFVKHRHGNGPLHLASESDGMVFEIYPVEQGAHPTRDIRLGFEVQHVEEVVSLLLASGDAELISPPKPSPWGIRAVLKDLDGNKLELIQSVEI